MRVHFAGIVKLERGGGAESASVDQGYCSTMKHNNIKELNINIVLKARFEINVDIIRTAG